MVNRNFTRWMVLLGLANVLYVDAWGADPGSAQNTSPDAAQVSSEIVYVAASRGELRSGPSDDFYPTDYLQQGTSLEVYHHTNDNWLGVRPPAGSFSWVPAADAYLLPGGKVIEITSPNAVSWIGTSLGSAKQYRWQVKLNPGEQLGVLGEQLTQGADGEEVLWYKIAPPAGEFRWIHANTVSSSPPTPQSLATKPNSGGQSRESATSRSAAAGSRDSSAVVSASYQTASSEGVIVLGEGSDYYDGGPQEGDVIYEGEEVRARPVDGEYIEGEYIEGEYIGGDMLAGPSFHSYGGGVVEGEIVDGEIIYEDGGYFAGPANNPARDRFAGWHAVDLNDDGMRLTWLERLYTRARQTGPDPLADDPFSLAMARGTVRPASEAAHAQMMAAGGVYEPTRPTTVKSTPTTPHRKGGWRDPSTLRQQRHESYQAAPMMAPPLSGLGGTAVDSEGPAGLMAAGLDRVSGALVSARNTLAGGAMQPNSDAAQPAAADVNWYGISTTATAAAGTSPLQANSLDLSQLQVSLSEMVTQPMQMWNLQSLYNSAQYYVEHGASAIERGQARLLMERIEEFADLAQRSGFVALNRTPGSQFGAPYGSSVSLAGASLGMAGAGVTTSEFQDTFAGAANFDATGWLVPVIAASAGQPTHALTDETGRILAYVSPVPGLNLDRYINQAVGVTGLRGYLPQLRAGHIQAQRVVRVQ